MSPVAEPGLRLADLLDEAAEDPRRGGWVLRGRIRRRSLGFAEARRLARRVGRELDARGLRKGDHVVLWGDSGPEWIVAFLGAMLRGVVVVPLDDLAGAAFARRVAAATEPHLAFVSRASVETAREAFGTAVDLLVLDDLRKTVGQRDAGPLEPVIIDPADPLQIVFTSGTTSEPKGVVLSHRNILANLVPIQRVYARWDRRVGWLLRRRAIVSLLPLSHVFGQSVGIFVPLMMRLRAVFVAVPSPGAIREALQRERALVAMAVPRFLAALRRELERDLDRTGRLERHRRRRARWISRPVVLRPLAFAATRRRFGWRFCGFIVGGSALDPEEERAWTAMGYLVVQGYGLTETAPIVTINAPFSRRAGLVGKPIGEQSVRLAPDGEVLVRGGNVAEGYLRDGAIEPLVDEDGWFHTGDLGELDGAGRLRIVGRAKDVIVGPEGLNVYPSDVERVLDEQPGVREAAVVGLPREEGEEVHAALLLDEDADGLGAEEARRRASAAIAGANDQLASYQRVRGFTVWPESDFPRTRSTRKVQKRAIVEALLADPSGGRGSGGTGGLRGLLQDVLGDRAAAGDQTLEQLDLSSLDVVELVSRIEGQLGVELDESGITSETTLDELAASVRRPGASRAPAIPRWASTFPVRLAGALMRGLLGTPLLAAFAPLTVRGRENLAGRRGPFLVIANHLSYLDAPVVFRSLPFAMSFRLGTVMATEPFEPHFSGRGTVWQRLWQALRYTAAVVAFNAFPLPRSGGFSRSLRRAGELVESGASVLLFPEGRMTLDGKDQPFRDGVGVLAAELGVPILPVRLDGLYEVFPTHARLPRRGRATVTIGTPIVFEPDTPAEEITRQLEVTLRGPRDDGAEAPPRRA